jgi:hypothetical protein
MKKIKRLKHERQGLLDLLSTWLNPTLLGVSLRAWIVNRSRPCR